MSKIDFRAWNYRQSRFCHFTVAPVIIAHDQDHYENRGMILQHTMHGLALSREAQAQLDLDEKNPDYGDTEKFTGRRDVHSRKIYEGDVVIAVSKTGTVKADIDQTEGIVMWDDDGCDFNICRPDGTFLAAFGTDHTDYEIIGHVHEPGRDKSMVELEP